MSTVEVFMLFFVPFVPFVVAYMAHLGWAVAGRCILAFDKAFEERK
jgi:hypothetical protein